MFKRTMKLLALFTALAISHVASADTHTILTTYPDLLATLTKGNSVRAIMELNKCTSDSNSIESKNVLGGINFTHFNKHQIQAGPLQKNVVSTSTTILVESSTLGPVFNYLRLRVYEDNTAELFSEMLDPKTYTQLRSATFNCRLSNGGDQNGIILYNLS